MIVHDDIYIYISDMTKLTHVSDMIIFTHKYQVCAIYDN